MLSQRSGSSYSLPSNPLHPGAGQQTIAESLGRGVPPDFQIRVIAFCNTF
jgi:hypothetical protein